MQCVGSREEPRNFCSRICCATTLKQALALKEANPDLQIYVFYRDMMTYGFLESYYTRARQAGIVFIQYDPDEKPVADVSDDIAGGEKPVHIDAFEPILGRRILIDADLLVLATGIAPLDPRKHRFGRSRGAAQPEDPAPKNPARRKDCGRSAAQPLQPVRAMRRRLPLRRPNRHAG